MEMGVTVAREVTLGLVRSEVSSRAIVAPATASSPARREALAQEAATVEVAVVDVVALLMTSSPGEPAFLGLD